MGVRTPKASQYVPVSTLSVDSKIIDLQLKVMSTPEGGCLLGILKPTWIKTLESEMRLTWLKKMMEKILVVRNIGSFVRNLEEYLRVER